MSKLTIATFPRSGSHLLESYIMQRYDIKIQEINKTHQRVKDDSIKISIARNPYDSITSSVAMLSSIKPDINILDLTNKKIWGYLSFQKYLLKDFDGAIFSYDSLINIPEKVIVEVGDIFGLHPKNTDRLISSVSSPIGYIKSSKGLDSIKIAKQIIEKKDLSECFVLYKEVLKKAKI